MLRIVGQVESSSEADFEYFTVDVLQYVSSHLLKHLAAHYPIHETRENQVGIYFHRFRTVRLESLFPIQKSV